MRTIIGLVLRITSIS